MKTHRNLWNVFVSKENFELAARKAVKGKKSKREIRAFMANRAKLLEQLRQNVMHGQFKTSEYRVTKIFEPKERIIYVLPLYPDHILHHALINVLGPIWQKIFVRDSYACIPGRGLHAASKRVMQFMRKNQYVLQCDIRKFYPSINHELMIQSIARKIRDKRILNLLRNIVCSVKGETNVPIGNLTSQWFGNVYLHELDVFVKHRLHWPCYVRYCDDFCLFGNNKSELQACAVHIKMFLWQCLRLTFSRCAVRPVSAGLSFVGYRHFSGFILLRKRGAVRIRKRLLNIAVNNDRSKLAVGQIASARGWLKWAQSFHFAQNVMRHIAQTGASPHTVMFIRSRLL